MCYKYGLQITDYKKHYLPHYKLNSVYEPESTLCRSCYALQLYEREGNIICNIRVHGGNYAREGMYDKIREY